MSAVATRDAPPVPIPDVPGRREAVPPQAGRGRERNFLLALLPLAALAAFALTRSTGAVQPALPEVARALGIVVAGCLALHVLFCATRFDGDPFILPALGVIFVLGMTYHLG